jgi:hypothetical protein
MRSKKEDPNSKRADDEHSRRLCKEKQRFCRGREEGTKKSTPSKVCVVYTKK